MGYRGEIVGVLNVESASLQKNADKMVKLADRINSIYSRFERTRRTLDWDVMGEEKLDKSVSLLLRNLGSISGDITGAGTVLQNIGREYAAAQNAAKDMVYELPADVFGPITGGNPANPGMEDITQDNGRNGETELKNPDAGKDSAVPDMKETDTAGAEKAGTDKADTTGVPIEKEIIVYSAYDKSLESVLDIQMKKSPKIYKNGKWVDATREEVRQYLDPANYDEGVYMYQFLDLSASAGISEEDMAKFLEGKGILEGKAKVFLEAAQKYNVSEVYLAAHSALETGNGKSVLANGVEVNGVTVYNMFGIGAYDSDPIGAGAQFAYKMGWTTPEKAIEGGAKWISEQYINNPSYRQNTLYKMRWNPESPGTHQYATDIAWAVKQTSNIKKMYDNFQNASLKFDIPAYGGG